MTIRVGVNGLGRIGRCVMRAVSEEGYDDIEIVAVNGPANGESHQHLLQYDSVHGRFGENVLYDKAANTLNMGRGAIRLTHSRDINELDWGAMGVDIVLECTGAFTTAEACQTHLQRGAKKVLISAPAKDDCPTIVYGVNHESLRDFHDIISVGSCTTNCLAPLAMVLDRQFGIEAGYMTTIHAFTGDQNLVDGSHKDMRRARAATMSMVLTSTGAAKAIGLVLPQLQGKLKGSAIRVPTPNVSMVDLTFIAREPVIKEVINAALSEAADSYLKGILEVNEAPLVSIDFTHNRASSIADLTQTSVVDEKLVHVAAWYDNEWGFSCRMLDLTRELAKHM